MEFLPIYFVRPMREKDIPEVIKILKDTGCIEDLWSISKNSIYTWFGIDPKGFLVAETEDAEIIGVCSATLQHPSLLFVGTYTVKPKFQKQGVGKSIWKKILDIIGERNAGLNSVSDYVVKYAEQGGFPVNAEWTCTTWISEKFAVEKITEMEDHMLSFRRIVLHDDYLKRVVEYDKSIVGFSRDELVGRSLEEEETVTMVALSTTTSGKEEVSGYGSARVNLTGAAVISPLYANTPGIAIRLVMKLLRVFPFSQRQGLCMMISTQNDDAIAMAEELDLEKCADMTRMYKTEVVEAEFSKIFSLHSIDFSVF